MRASDAKLRILTCSQEGWPGYLSAGAFVPASDDYVLAHFFQRPCRSGPSVVRTQFRCIKPVAVGRREIETSNGNKKIIAAAVGVQGTTSVWAPGQQPLPPKPWSGVGRKPRLLRRDADHQPVSVKALAMGLPASDYRLINWRAGSNTDLSSRFAAVRVRAAHRDHWRAELRDEEWLLVEWSEGQSEPDKYILSTLPADTSLERLVAVTKMRWRIERDYQDLKQEFGLADYEGRGWRGFHHHATLCIAAYGFLVAERLRHKDTKKTPYSARNLPYPKVTCRGAARRAQRHVPNSISTLRWISAQTLANPLQRCPCCARKSEDIDWLF